VSLEQNLLPRHLQVSWLAKIFKHCQKQCSFIKLSRQFFLVIYQKEFKFMSELTRRMANVFSCLLPRPQESSFPKSVAILYFPL
jgi:hypothetical protein